MNILVTGGAGYIGSITVEKLCDGKNNVIVVDTLEEGFRDAVHPKATFIKGNFGDEQLLNELFKKFKIEVVIHFAAYASVPLSMEKPAVFFENNIKNSIVLLNAMVENNCDKMIFSSSAATYGNPVEIPMTENHPQIPINPYGESKLMFEKILKWYNYAYNLKFNAFRYFCAAGASEKYGENHPNESHLIPLTLFTALGRREKLFVFGDDYDTKDGSGVRDFIHVSDIADAHIMALDNLDNHPNSIYNLGCNEGFSVFEVIKAVERITGKKVNYEVVERRKGDPASLIASNTLAKKDLGWRPLYGLDDMISSAFKWFNLHPNGYKK